MRLQNYGDVAQLARGAFLFPNQYLGILVRDKMLFMRVLVLAMLFGAQSAFAQVADFQRDYNKINEHLMLTLGSYAVGNFAISGAGYFNAEDEYTKHFHEMNVEYGQFWVGTARLLEGEEEC